MKKREKGEIFATFLTLSKIFFLDELLLFFLLNCIFLTNSFIFCSQLIRMLRDIPSQKCNYALNRPPKLFISTILGPFVTLPFSKHQTVGYCLLPQINGFNKLKHSSRSLADRRVVLTTRIGRVGTLLHCKLTDKYKVSQSCKFNHSVCVEKLFSVLFYTKK